MGLVFLLHMLVPAPLPAQVVSGLVAEQVSLRPVAGAHVTLLEMDADSDQLVEVTSAVSDEDGAFLLAPGRPGTFRVQAEFDGLSSPLSPEIQVSDTEGLDDLVLLVPSRHLMRALSCDREQSGSAVVVGEVWEPEAELALPGAIVRARWESDGQATELVVEADEAGRFVACRVPPVGPVQIRAEILGVEGAWEEVEISRPAIVFHDIEVALGGAERSAAEIFVELLRSEEEGTSGVLRGILLDLDTEAPIQGAIVRLRGGELQTLTDDSGRFTLSPVPPGAVRLEFEHIAYGIQSLELEMPAEGEAFARASLSAQAIRLDEVTVSARAGAIADRVRRSPTRVDIVAGPELLEAEERGATITDVLRTVPGIRITPGGQVFHTRALQGFRGVERMLIIVDGIWQEEFPATLNEIESIEVLSPLAAGVRYGLRGSAGVLVIHTRGRGPYVDRARNRE